MGRLELQLLYWASRLVILLLLPIFISDIELYQSYANRLLHHGELPYRDFSFEYPPLAYLLLLGPAYLQQQLGWASPASFRLLFALPILAADFFLFRSFRRQPPVKGAAFYYLFLSSLLPFLLFDRFDLLIGFSIAFPFLSHRKEAKFAWAWALGGATKLVTFLLLPLCFLDRPGLTRRRFAGLAWPALLLLAVSVGVAAGLGKVTFLSRHNDRGVQVESLAGSAIMAAQATGLIARENLETNFGAQHLKQQVKAAKAFFWGGLLLTALAILALGIRERLDSLRAAWLLLLSFITFGYVLSPQFLFWLLPLLFPVLAVLDRHRQRQFLGLFGAIVAITGLHFLYYWSYVNLNPGSVALVCLRNLLLLLLLAVSWAWLPLRRSLP